MKFICKKILRNYEKIFKDNIKYYCNAKTLEKIDKEIIRFLTKKIEYYIK